MKHLVCISCPKGCRLSVDEENDFSVSGNGCKRGEIYGRQEVSNPQRTVTSTVAVSGSSYVRCPVKTDRTIAKALMFDAMKTLQGLVVAAPVRRGQIIVKNVCGTDANFIATADISSL